MGIPSFIAVKYFDELVIDAYTDVRVMVIVMESQWAVDLGWIGQQTRPFGVYVCVSYNGDVYEV